MNDLNDKLKELKTEDFIWLIYIGIIVLSWLANNYERKYFIFNDLKDKEKYRNLMILIFSILIVSYSYFFKSSYDDYNNLNINDSLKKRKLTFLSLIGSVLVLLSGIIFLYIAVSDENVDVELAFN